MKSLLLFALFAFILSPTVQAQWKLSNDDSSIHFVSIKKSKVAETHTFKSLSGNIDKQGKVELAINLASVETYIPIRNTRMKEMLFNVGKFAEATLSGTVNTSRLANLTHGESYTDSVTLQLSLHGITQEVAGDVRVTKLAGEKLLITSLTPVIISAEDYNLTEGVEKLRAVAKLPSISTAVPVSYSLVFTQ